MTIQLHNHIESEHFNINEESKKLYFVLVDAPYPDDRVSSSSEEPVKRRV